VSEPLSRRNPTGSSAPDGAAPTDETPDVFLSYSRTDQPVVLRLAVALEEADWSVWIDREDVPPASEWRDELALGIRTAHTFVFVLSKDSVKSDYCRWELGEAVRLGKRLIPVVIEDVKEAPDQLASRQYIFARPQDDFAQAVSTLSTALATDLDWVREHRHWLLEAMRWDSHDRDRSLLVRGRDLKQAEAWFSRQGANLEPRPTELQAQYLLASRAWETRRTQIVAVAVAVALAVTIVLGIAALLQRNRARDQAATARSRELAIAADSQIRIDPERSLLLAKEAVRTKATAEADNALRRAMQEDRLLAEIPVRAKRIGALVNDVSFSPDGKRVAAAAKGGTVMVAAAGGAGEPILLPTGRPGADDICSNGAGGAQHDVTFSPDGTQVAAADDFGRISVWRLSRPAAPVTSPFCLARATPPTAVDLLGLLTGNRVFPPAALAFSSGEVVQLVESDGDVTRWRWETDAKPTVVSRGGGAPVDAAFSNDAGVVAVALDGSVRVRPRGSSTWRTLPLRDVHAIAVSGDGSTVAAVSGRSIFVSHPAESTDVQTLRAPATVRAIAVDRSGDALAIGDSRNAIRVWDLTEDDASPTVLAGSAGVVTAVAFSADGKKLVSGSDDGVVRVWAADAGRPVRARLVSDGRLLALSAQSATRGWILSDGTRRPLAGLPEVVDELSVSRDGSRAAVAADAVVSGAVRLWDTSGGPQPREITFARGVNGVAVSPDGSRLAVAEGRTFRIVPWLSTEGAVLASSDEDQYTTPAFSPDGRRVAVADYTGKSSTVLVWNVGSGHAPIRRFSAVGGVTDIDYSDDGNTLVASASDGAVRIVDVEGDSPPVVLRGHEGPANGVGLSPDGSELVSGGSDGSIRVWELETGKDVAFSGPGGPIADVAFTSEGSSIVASSTEATRIFGCRFCGSTSEVLARADRATARELTAAERALFLHER
jgi:WD40 repeat protein